MAVSFESIHRTLLKDYFVRYEHEVNLYYTELK